MSELEIIELQKQLVSIIAPNLNSQSMKENNMQSIFPTLEKKHPGITGVKKYIEKDHKLFIDGEWVESESSDEISVFEPSTGQYLCSIPEANESDVDRAVKSARHAFEVGEWAQMRPREREKIILKLADLLEHYADQLATIEAIDNGKPLSMAKAGDLTSASNYTRYMAGWCTKIHGETKSVSAPGQHFAYTMKQAVGVVAAIIPWNFPLLMAVWKIVPALVTGCTVVLKPAEQTSLTALRLADICTEAGVPKGVVNIITGTGRVTGSALVRHKLVSKVAFTGSTLVGKEIGKSAMENLSRVSLELGGKSPMIALADANIDLLAKGAANAIFYNQGQVCCAGSRLYVHESIHDQVVSKIAAIANQKNIATGLSADCEIGPLISKEQKQRVEGYIAKGIAEGAILAAGDREVPGEGYFVAPTVFTNTNNEMSIVKEEIFGPVLVVQSFKTIEEAITLANDSIYGLGASIWSNDLVAVNKIIPKIEAGVVWVNTHNIGDPSQPFGGMKSSGFGREQSREQLDLFLETKSVWLDLNA